MYIGLIGLCSPVVSKSKILWQKAAFICKEKSLNTFLTVLMQYNTAGLIKKELVGYQFDLKTLYNALAYTSFWFFFGLLQ